MATDMPDPSILQTFPTPTAVPFVIEHVAEEFTSVCPMTGHPDYGVITLRYQPAPPPAAPSAPTHLSHHPGCVELKSLKLYYHSFRNHGIFYEAVSNQIRDDLVAIMKPQWLQVITEWKGRGGIRSVVRADFGPVPEWYRGR
jgi:7-cyano-7-deazaguanine reductase